MMELDRSSSSSTNREIKTSHFTWLACGSVYYCTVPAVLIENMMFFFNVFTFSAKIKGNCLSGYLEWGLMKMLQEFYDIW